MYTTEKIAAIAAMPDTAFKYKHQFQSLLDFYLWIKETWTATAIKQLATENELSLRGHENKAKFARLAAQTILNDSQPILSPSQLEDGEPNPNPGNQNNQTVRILAIALTLLPPVGTTNGLEQAPAWQILGSPIYFAELQQNFQKLIWYWHPDRNPDPTAEDRTKLIRDIYQRLATYWDVKYSPLLPISKLNTLAIDKAMSKTFDWSPDSFWTDDLRSKSFRDIKAGI